MAHHQGMSLLSLALPAARPADAAALRVGPAVPGDRCCCCRSASRRPRRSIRSPPSCPTIRATAGGAGGAGARLRQRPTRRSRRCSCCRTAATTSWSPTPAAATAAGRTSPSPAGAKTAPATTGARSATSATWRAASSGRPRISRRSSAPERYEAIFSEARAEFRRRDHDFETHTEIAVSPEDDIELRRVRITNRSRTRADDRGHQLRRGRARAAGRRRAASGVQQPVRADRDRRASGRRSSARAGRARADEQPPWMFHLMAVHGAESLRRLLRDRPLRVHRPRPHASPRRRR